MSFQIQHIIYGFYCGTYEKLSYWWPYSGRALPIFKFESREQAMNLIRQWNTSFGMDLSHMTIQEFDQKLSDKMAIQSNPVVGKC